MKVTVISNSIKKELTCEKGENLLSILQKHGYRITASCGGRGVCGKCKVKVINGDFENIENGYVLSCVAKVNSDCEIEVFETSGGGLTYTRSSQNQIDSQQGFGVALDIGTTTLAFSLVNLQTGEEIKTKGVLNSQGSFGADVISRIVSSNEGNTKALQQCVLNQTREMLELYTAECGEKIKKLYVCGNTTMLHLFLATSVEGIGKYPFIPEFVDTVRLLGKELNLPVDEVVLLPSVAAYLGADVVAGGIACDIGGANNLLVDIGTNGEMLLHTNGKFYSTSTAAGPCFEGANIECGTGGVAGAIDHLTIKDGKTEYTTIGDKEPVGICGAGLVDAVAEMFKCEVFDESGAFNGDEDKFYLTDKVYISQKDIRNYQLAKSAVFSGIKVLIMRSGLEYKDIDKLFIAGGLGFYLNKENAVETGLLPKELKDKIEVIGNSALAGTRACMLSKKCLEFAEKLAKDTEYIDLSADPDFMDEYILNMNFGEPFEF